MPDPLLVNRFPNVLAPNVPNNILRNFPFCYFSSFLIVLLTLFINKRNYLSELTILMISFISSFKIINVVIPDPNIFLLIVVPVDDAATVNPSRSKSFLANGLNTFFIKGKPFFSNCPKILPKNPLNCLILAN